MARNPWVQLLPHIAQLKLLYSSAQSRASVGTCCVTRAYDAIEVTGDDYILCAVTKVVGEGIIEQPFPFSS